MNTLTRSLLQISTTLTVTLAAGTAASAQGSDTCMSPQVLPGGGVYNYDTTGATTDGGTTNCSGDIFNDVWFSLTTVADGFLAFSNCGGGSLDTRIAVYEGLGCPTAGTELASNDNSCGLQSMVSVRVTAGTTYMIRLGSAIDGETGTGLWSIYDPTDLGSRYCSSVPTSTGSPAQIWVEGSDSLLSRDTTLFAGPLPQGTALFYYGTTQIQAPFGNGGFRCAGGGVRRLNPSVPVCNGQARTQVFDSGAAPVLMGRINFQCWFRDNAAGGDGFNTSDAISIDYF